MKRRGATLGLVLLVLSVSLVVVFSLASLSTVCLRTSATSENEDHARNLAESAIAMGMDRVCVDSSFAGTVNVPVDGYPPDSSGLLTFDASLAASRGVKRSFNNLGSKLEQSTVPGETVRLVGLGKCGHARVELECLYYRPSFPLGLVTGGSLNATGLQMVGLMPGKEFLGDVGSHVPADKRPVDLHSNANVTLDGHCEISGDVSAVGTIHLEPETQVRGEVRPRVAPATLPTLDLGAVRSSLSGVDPLDYVPGRAVEWFTQTPGPLTINGDLVLSGGLLYVPGSLTVNGRVLGRGAVVARGDLTVTQGSATNPRDVLVLACDGQATLRGSSGAQYLHGLVYCGTLDAHDMTLVGSVVSRGHSELHQVTLVQTEVATRSVLGRPMRSTNNDDVFFWYVNRGEPDPVTLEPRYDYYLGIYIVATTGGFDGNPNFAKTGKNKTRAELTQEFLAFSDVDYQPVDDLSPGHITPGSQMLSGPLTSYLGVLDAAGPTSVNFDLNRLLTPTKTARVLYWGRVTR